MVETPPGGSRWPEPTLFFEDFAPGQVIDLGTYEMTEAEIIDFGRRFDPQYFHMDPGAARGHSMGGAALLLAEEQSPGMFTGMFLYEPIVLPEGHFARLGDNPLARGPATAARSSTRVARPLPATRRGLR